MSPRNSVLLALLVLVILGAYVYTKSGDEDVTDVVAPATLIAVEGSDVREIVIERANGTVIRLEPTSTAAAARDDTKSGDDSTGDAVPVGQWHLTEPLMWKADATRVDSMLNVLGDLRAVRTVTDEEGSTTEGSASSAQSLDAYGLDEPAMVITVRTEMGEHELRIGDTTPVGQTVYAQVGGDPTVYTVSMFDVIPFIDTVSNYRDRSIIEVSADEVQTIQITKAGTTVTLERENGTWNLTEPLHHPANTESVNELLQPITVLHALEFIDTPASLGEYGLDDAQAQVRLTVGEGDEQTTHVLYIGAAIDDASAYVKTDGPTVYVVPLDPTPFAQASADELGLKDIVLTSDIFTPQIELVAETGLSLTLMKSESQSEGITWRRGDGRVVEPRKMTDFLGALIAIDAQDLGRPVDDVNALDLNYVILRLQAPPGEGGEGWPRLIRFGRPAADGTVEVVVNTRNRVYTTSVEVLETLLEQGWEILLASEEDDE